jgi:hypothetical protein
MSSCEAAVYNSNSAIPALAAVPGRKTSDERSSGIKYRKENIKRRIIGRKMPGGKH